MPQVNGIIFPALTTLFRHLNKHSLRTIIIISFYHLFGNLAIKGKLACRIFLKAFKHITMN